MKGNPNLCHGTKKSAIDDIFASGFLKSRPWDVDHNDTHQNSGGAGMMEEKGRSCIHFSPYEQSDYRCVSGMRKGSGTDCQIFLDIESMIRDKFQIYLTASGAMMVEGNVPTRYIEVIKHRVQGQSRNNRGW